jgi:hypothetical protein
MQLAKDITLPLFFGKTDAVAKLLGITGMSSNKKLRRALLHHHKEKKWRT